MNGNVLIVDDSMILRAYLKKAVRIIGFDPSCVYEACNGQDALVRIDEHPIDLILLDINMPVMNGEEFLEALNPRADRDRYRVIVVSTESNDDRLASIGRLGVDAVIHKPFEPEDLAHLLSKPQSGAKAS